MRSGGVFGRVRVSWQTTGEHTQTEVTPTSGEVHTHIVIFPHLHPSLPPMRLVGHPSMRLVGHHSFITRPQKLLCMCFYLCTYCNSFIFIVAKERSNFLGKIYHYLAATLLLQLFHDISFVSRLLHSLIACSMQYAKLCFCILQAIKTGARSGLGMRVPTFALAKLQLSVNECFKIIIHCDVQCAYLIVSVVSSCVSFQQCLLTHVHRLSLLMVHLQPPLRC